MLWPAVSGSIVMATAVVAFQLGPPVTLALPLRVLAEVAVGGGAYAATLLVVHRERLTSVLRFLRRVRAHA